MSRIEVIGAATLYLGDCRDVLPTIGEVDAVVTDPPYGVNGGSGTKGLASAKTKYTASGWSDTPEYISDVCAPMVALALSIAKRGLVFPGAPNAFKYPAPTDMGCVYQPAAVGMGKWGRVTFQPVLFYGKDPRAGLTIQPIHYINTERSDDCGHPCPKPQGLMRWAVHRASLDCETVLDPFMGSATTGIVAVQMGRKFIGIERDEGYFDIACRRIEQAQRQTDMFIERATA